MKEVLATGFVYRRGRIGRGLYLSAWMACVSVILLGGMLGMIFLALAVEAAGADPATVNAEHNGYVGAIIAAGMLLTWTYIGSNLGIRRLHDLGWSGRWVLPYHVLVAISLACGIIAGSPMSAAAVLSDVLLVPLAIASLVLLLVPGEAGWNQYGPVPAERHG